MKPLTVEGNESFSIETVCRIWKKYVESDNDKKNYHKVQNDTDKHKGAAHSICNLRYKIPKETHAVLHNGLCYDSHFIIRELPEKIEGQFESLGKNVDNYIIGSVLIRKWEKKMRMVRQWYTK